MKKLFLITSVFLAVFLLAGCSKNTVKIIEEAPLKDAAKITDEAPLVVNQVCSQLCEQIKGSCPSLGMISNCEESCMNWDDNFKEEIALTSSCREIMEKQEIMEMLIPEINEPELKEATNDCESACNNYVSACLTLVPNASASLFDEGRESCLGECEKWNASKVECMVNASNCESMTNVCGL